MSAWDDPSDPGNDPGSLRKAIDKANAAAKKYEADLVAEREKTAKLETAVRTSAVEGQLRTLGIKEANNFANLVPADVEPTESALKAWVESNKSIYNFGDLSAPQAQQTPTPQEPKVDGQPNPQEQVSTDPLAGIDPKLVDSLVQMGVLSDRSQASTGAERQRFTEDVANAKPISLDDAKGMLKGMGIELVDSGGFNSDFYRADLPAAPAKT